MQVWNVLHTAHWNTGRKNSPTLSGYIFATYRQLKKLSNINVSSTCPHNMVNSGPLKAEIDWWVWGTPENFNEFHVLASLLQRRCSTEVNQTLHDVWSSPGLVCYIYTFWASSPLTEFCQVQNSLCVKSCVLLYWYRFLPKLHQSNIFAICSPAFNRGRHLYLAGRPSRGAYSICCGPVSVRPSQVKTAKRRIKQTTPHDSQGTLVFWRHRCRGNSTIITANGGAKYR